MSTSTLPAVPLVASRRSPRDARRVRRIAAATVLVVPATCVALARIVARGFASADTAGTLDAITASPGRQNASLVLGVLAMLTLVPAFLAAARLARRRRPVLAMIAAGVNLAAYLGTGLASPPSTRSSRSPHHSPRPTARRSCDWSTRTRSAACSTSASACS